MTAPFMYHSGKQSLVYAHPEKMGVDAHGNLVVQGYMAFPTQDLRAFGYIANDADLVRMLPRFDMSLIAPPAAGMNPQMMKKLQDSLRTGGKGRR